MRPTRMPLRAGKQRSRRVRRRGTTAVETAMILPVFLAFLFGLFEYGRAQMVSNMLQVSCRSAARYGSTEDVTTANVEQYLLHMMAPAVESNHITVLIRDANVYDDEEGTLPTSSDDFANLPNIDLDEAEPRQLFVVRASIDYDDIALLHLPFISGATITGQAFMRHE